MGKVPTRSSAVGQIITDLAPNPYFPWPTKKPGRQPGFLNLPGDLLDQHLPMVFGFGLDIGFFGVFLLFAAGAFAMVIDLERVGCWEFVS